MALTPFRWVSLALIGCMLAVLALVSVADIDAGRAPRFPTSDSAEARLREQAGALNQTAQRLAARYRVIYLMDSAARAVARVPDTGSLRVFIADGYRPETRTLFERRIAAAQGERDGRVGRVDVVVVSDTPRVVRGVTRYLGSPEVRYQFPERPNDRCRVFIRTFHPSNTRNSWEAERAPQHLLGPCGFYAAFGEPGPAIRQWITSVGWQYMIEGSWTNASSRIQLPEDERLFKGPDPATRLLNVESGATECMKGNLDLCERMVTIRPPSRWRGPLVGAGTYAISLGQNRYYPGAIGYEAGELMSDAVRELGRERFKAFWASTEPVAVAYEKASGERWGAFLQRWMISHYGEIHPGPRMSAYALFTSTVLVILALGATMMMSVRRTYS